MAMSGGHRTALLVSLCLMLLTVFGDPPLTSGSANLPEITMTSGGGFSPSSLVWTIAPDGSWTWAQKDRSTRGLYQPPRNGRLTDSQRDELAVLATDPRLRLELRQPHGRCQVSDGSTERLAVGSLRYLASWCDEHRPRIRQLRARIRALTAV